MTQQNYTARWSQPGQPSRASVGFVAKTDAAAIRKADRIAREVDCCRTPRTITRSGGGVIECIQTGVSSPSSSSELR